MDFQSLKLFLDLAQSQNFARTAEKHYMSASTLSRHIQRMEAELNQPLFARDNRHVKLTEAGRQFLAFAEQSWANWLAFQQHFDASEQELAGELRLFCSVTASYSHLPRILARFRQRYPKVEIQLTTGDPAQGLHYVQSMQADLSLAGKPEHLPNSIAFHRIDDIQLSLIAPRVACVATQLLQQQPIDWQKIPFISPLEGHARQRLEQWFKSQKIKSPKIYATVAGHEAILPMVALGCGVALLPDVVIKHSPMGSQVSLLDFPFEIPSFELGVCIQQRRLQEPILKAFWALLSQEPSS